MIFALCSASLIHCITLSYSQETVYSHLNVIFNEGARGTQCGAPPPHPKSVGAPALRKIWEKLRKCKREKRFSKMKQSEDLYLRQNWDLSHYRYCKKSPKAQFETNTRKKWDLVKTRKRKKWAFFFLSGRFVQTDHKHRECRNTLRS